jgi:hypothetical protein
MTADGQQADPALAFLLRLSVQFDLVEAGLKDVEEAVDDALHMCHVFAPCLCGREILDNIERLDRKIHLDALWRWRRR